MRGGLGFEPATIGFRNRSASPYTTADHLKLSAAGWKGFSCGNILRNCDKAVVLVTPTVYSHRITWISKAWVQPIRTYIPTRMHSQGTRWIFMPKERSSLSLLDRWGTSARSPCFTTINDSQSRKNSLIAKPMFRKCNECFMSVTVQQKWAHEKQNCRFYKQKHFYLFLFFPKNKEM